jgi:endonuclease YncB( thermonuclease family)
VLATLLLAGLFILDRRPALPERPPDPVLRPSIPAPAERPAETKLQERPVEPAGTLTPNQPVELNPPFLIVDGLTFTVGLNTYRLDGLSGPPATAACRNDAGHLWACGLQARAALNNAIQRNTLVCTPTRTNADGTIQAKCTADGVDVGGELATQGWARPAVDSFSIYSRQAKEAEQDRRGLWNGRWTFSTPG